MESQVSGKYSVDELVYVLLRTSKKESTEKDEEAVGEVPASPVATIKPVIPDKEQVVGPIPAPLKVLPPIAEQEQRELFQWILEEKRKVKPGDRAEKKKIDEEKALLKHCLYPNEFCTGQIQPQDRSHRAGLAPTATLQSMYPFVTLPGRSKS
ncbi:hypothetical protein C4D60_Mb08t05020 [Musa balbisiana]|uniref:Uncharacterized protein n=1 Tax=Musa balbisiana TaxID=52838 RepID=A0A4V4H8P7_MUSBA|nr:hypothetical protein C4D60_Mb08t05020 [Musa balbisiana]